MKSAKINVSAEELDLVKNKEWLHMKRMVIDKVFHFMGGLNDDYQLVAKDAEQRLSYLPINRMGKISRGENLEGLPYVIMDYPALFSKDKKIAVRTLFWWGHFFSISLHLGGLCVTAQETLAWLEYFHRHAFFINISGNEWNYEFGDDGFMPLDGRNNNIAEAVSRSGIFRVARQQPLDDWAAAQINLVQAFTVIIKFLELNFPADEKGLSPGFPKAGSHL